MSSLIDFDQKLIEEYGTIAGLDEAGRGALAGPVFVGCVVGREGSFDDEELAPVNDSKQLSPGTRDRLFDFLTRNDELKVGIGQASNVEIDELGITEAANRAASRALASITSPVNLLLLDRGLDAPERFNARSLTRGDEKSFCIAAASVLAKVGRDRYMRSKADRYPVYGWKTNVGYGTAEHRNAIKNNGLSPLHRRSYAAP